MGWLTDILGLGGDAPDTSGVNAAAVKNADISQQELDWFKQLVADTAPDRAAATQRANQVSDAQLEAMKFATDEAKRQSQRNQSTFEPLENQIVTGAQNYDTPARRHQAAAQATADVERAFGSSQGALQRSLGRAGISVSSPRSIALMNDAALEKAKALAGATSGAVNNVEQQGYARQMDAAALGRGIASNQATQQQIAGQSGGASVGASNAALGAATSAAPLMAQGFGGALAGNTAAGNLYGQAASLTNQARGQDLNFMGDIFGGFMRSDKKIKKNTGKKADGDKALAQINDTPVEEGWQYDPAKGGPDDGGQAHTGPMAQSVRKSMGERAAPGGKVIDPITVQGKVLAGMQALSKRVAKLEQRKAA